jgi:thiosulfate/3-mercaptopyruvate sulfurtransferase
LSVTCKFVHSYFNTFSIFSEEPPNSAAFSLSAVLIIRLDDPAVCVLDARSADRYRGENETIDPVAGRIAGAVSAPYADNLGPDGRFLPPEELRSRYQELLAEASPAQAVVYCGSGVTAAHNLLAMAQAGLPQARLYPGSWSEWITNPERPRAVG